MSFEELTLGLVADRPKDFTEPYSGKADRLVIVSIALTAKVVP